MFTQYFNKYSKVLLPLVFTVAAPMMAHSATFDLNFGDFSDSDFGTSSDDLVMYYEDVATGVNATLTAATTFSAKNPQKHGAVEDDIRINMRRDNSVELTLTLWDSTIGTGYDTEYSVDDGTFDWNVVFYDLDGIVGDSTDNLTLLSASTYTVTTTTDLTITETEEGYVQFIGGGAGNVPGEDGITEFTQDQADVAVSVNVDNLASLTFIYEATGVSSSDRNLLIDGGSLTTSLLTFETVTDTVTINPVPLPASAALLMGGLITLGAGQYRLKRRKTA